MRTGNGRILRHHRCLQRAPQLAPTPQVAAGALVDRDGPQTPGLWGPQGFAMSSDYSRPRRIIELPLPPCERRL